MENLVREINGSDLNKIDKGPNFGYLDKNGVFHVWHKKHDEYKSIEVPFDCIGGYAVINEQQVEAGVENGKVYCPSGYEVLVPYVKKLAGLE